VIDLIETLYRQRSVPRGDELDAHCADLWSCLRATWYRRQGLQPAPFSREKLAQFAIGHGYEQEVAGTLQDAGIDAEQGLRVSFLGLTGHPDIVIYAGDTSSDTVIEVKTTELVSPKDDVSPHYAIQAAFYALALNIPRAVVLVKHAKSHAEVVYSVDPEDYRDLIERRAAEVIEATAPGAPMPPMEPGELAPWGCRYCSWVRCARNPKWDGTREQEAFEVDEDEAPFP